MSRLTRDGTAEPVSRDQIFRHARGQGNIHFPCSADHEQDWQPHPVDAICDDHTYIHTTGRTQLRDPINSGLTRWRLRVYMDAVVESGRNPVSKRQIQRMDRLTRGETGENPSRETKFSGANGNRGKNAPSGSADREKDWQPCPG